MLDMDSRQLDEENGNTEANEEFQVSATNDGSDDDAVETEVLPHEQQQIDQSSGALFFNPKLEIVEVNGRTRIREKPLTQEEDEEWRELRAKLTRDYKRKHKEVSRSAHLSTWHTHACSWV